MKKKFILIFFLLFSLVSIADDKNAIISSIERDLDNDGEKESIFLSKLDNTQDTYGEVCLNLNSKKTETKINLGELNFNKTKLKEVIIGLESKPFIAVESMMDNNDYLLNLYSFNGTLLSEEASFISDAGIIEIKDANSDNKKDVLVLTRDYDSNPLKDFIVRIYSYDNNVWQEVSTYKTATNSYGVEENTKKQEEKIDTNVQKEISLMKEILDDYYKTASKTPHSKIEKAN